MAPAAPRPTIKQLLTAMTPPPIELKPGPTRKQFIFSILRNLCASKISDYTIDLCVTSLAEIKERPDLLLKATTLATSYLVGQGDGDVEDQVESIVRTLEATLFAANATE